MAERGPVSPFSSLSRSTQCKVALVWTKQNSPLYRLLCTNVLREVCQFFARRPLLVACNSKELTFFDPHTKKARKINLPQEKDSRKYLSRGMCVHIDDDQVFLCGGAVLERNRGMCIADAYLVDSSKVTPLSRMQRIRSEHGLYYDPASRRVFVFGGLCPFVTRCTNTCEQYVLASDSWSDLPNMKHATRSFSVCAHREKVYICCAFKKLIEVFSIDSREFTVAPINLEGIFTFYAIFTWKDKLVLYNRQNSRMFDANTYSLVAEFTLPILPMKMDRLVVSDVLFCLEPEKCSSLDLETMTLGPSYPLNG